MLKLDDIRLVEGMQVHGDSENDHTFYIMPQTPTFARMATGDLALRFVEYGQLREDGGKKFGGFVAFDVQLAVPAEKEQAIRAKLQEEVAARHQGRQAPTVVIAPIVWTGGTVDLLLSENGVVVEKLKGPGSPSLVSLNVAAFMIELTELGTAIFKDTLSSGSASGVQVVYHLDYYAQLPEMTARGEWHAEEFYKFSQDINTEDRFWSEDAYTEILESSRWKNDITTTEFNFVQDPNLKPEDQAKLESDITAAINQLLNEKVEKNLMEAIKEIDPDVKSLHKDQDIEDIKRVINKTQVSNVVVGWKSKKTIVTTNHPQGMLPSVTSLRDADGSPLVWEDYYSKISVDEFLKTLQVSVQVNADFERLPIHSVEVKLRYPHGPNAKTQEFSFTQADQVQKFEAFVHEGIRKYSWSYTVNYRNSSHTFQSEEIESDDTLLNVNVDDLGILALDIVDGDINFAQVPLARIEVSYDGAAPVQSRFNMTAEEKEFTLREIIRSPRTNPVNYRINYRMSDGREILGPQKEEHGKVLSVDDPFTSVKTVGFRAVGNLQTEISTILLSATYRDDAHDYTQEQNVNLSGAQPFFDWSFPVIDEETGKVTYSGTVNLADGTVRDVPETIAERSVIQAGIVTADFLEVSIVPDLVDWNLVKMVNASLSYKDSANSVNERADFLFRSGDSSKVWKIPLKDASKTDYESTVTYFLNDGTRKVTGPEPGTSLTVFLELPA